MDSHSKSWLGRFMLAPALAVLLAPALLPAAESKPPAEPADAATAADIAREKEQALERAEAEKLRRMREEQEARRREAARKLEAEQARQSEIVRLRTTVMNLERRESTLHHELRSMQQQLGTLSRDPGDHSAVTRRSELERQLGYSQNQLDTTTRSRESAGKRLDALRFKY